MHTHTHCILTHTHMYIYTCTHTHTHCILTRTHIHIHACTCIHTHVHTCPHMSMPADILDGNSKGIMRVILAIAERYQPNSIKPRSLSDASRPCSTPYQSDRDVVGGATGDHMTYTLHTDSNDLKRSQSPEGNLRGISMGMAANSSSVPNMVSMLGAWLGAWLIWPRGAEGEEAWPGARVDIGMDVLLCVIIFVDPLNSPYKGNLQYKDLSQTYCRTSKCGHFLGPRKECPD